jgi:hypothetical protein
MELPFQEAFFLFIEWRLATNLCVLSLLILVPGSEK